MDFDTSKYLGGLGAILLLVGFLTPRISPSLSMLSLIGFVLLLIGLNGLADYYKESGIFSDFLYGVVSIIVGLVLAVVAAFFLILPTVLATIFPGWTFGDWAALSTITPITPTVNQMTSLVASVAGGIIAVLVILCASSVIAAFLMRRSLNVLSKKSNVALFATTGTILLIGAILTIIGIGYILIWIAIIPLAIAFFTLKPTQPQAPTSTTT